MTAQASEILVYEGKEHWLFAEPLEEYFRQHPPRPALMMWHTANYRGYVGTWAIDDGRLYLVRLDLGLNRMPEERGSSQAPGALPAFLRDLAAGRVERVHAQWFAGELIVPQGEMLVYVHMGYESIFERELHIKISAGDVVGVQEVDNRDHAEERLAAYELRTTFDLVMGHLPHRVLARLLDPSVTDAATAEALLKGPNQRRVLREYAATFGWEETRKQLAAL